KKGSSTPIITNAPTHSIGTPAPTGSRGTVSTFTSSAILSRPCHHGFAEQAGWLGQQVNYDPRERARQLELASDRGNIGARQIFDEADDKAAGDGAGRARNAADDGRREAVKQNAEHHIRIEENDGGDHHPGNRADRRRETPAERQHPADPD